MISSWLHPLKGWSLLKTRGGSETKYLNTTKFSSGKIQISFGNYCESPQFFFSKQMPPVYLSKFFAKNIIDSGIKLFVLFFVIIFIFALAILLAQISKFDNEGERIPAERILILNFQNNELAPKEILNKLVDSQTGVVLNANNQPNGTFWIAIKLKGPQSRVRRTLELRMLRSEVSEFWKTDEKRSLNLSSASARTTKGGIAIDIEPTGESDLIILGKITPSGLARPKVVLWDKDKFDRSIRQFDIYGGVLLGAFSALALLSLLIACTSKDWSFFLFSGWLLTSLRVALINDGWDFHWINLSIAADYANLILKTSLAAHPLITLLLFNSILNDELQQAKLDKILKKCTAPFLFIITISPFLDYKTILPCVWATSAAGMVIVTTSLGIIVYRIRSTVSILYAISWISTFAGYIFEVGYASGMLSSSLSMINSRSASLISACMTAVALAERLRVERLGRLTAQREHINVLESLRKTYNGMPIGLFTCNLSDSSIRICNPEFIKTFGINKADFQKDKLFLCDLIGKLPYQKLTMQDATSFAHEVEVAIHDALANTDRWFLFKIKSAYDSLEGSIQDITDRKLAEARLRHLVDHDSLTGVRNRRGLEHALDEALSKVSSGIPCAVAHLSIDRFKLVNDLYGHGAGDLALQETATRILSAIRSNDHVARISDAFIVVFIDCPHFAATPLSDRLREAVAVSPYDIDGKRLDFTASVGVVSLDAEMSMTDVLASAGRACADAKERGRNCVVMLDERDITLRNHLDELKVVANLRKSVSDQRFFLEFQPIVSLHTPRDHLCYEILIRMREEDGTIIPPNRFIGAAERNGMMSVIDRWVLRNALEWLDSNPMHRDRIEFATLNISGASLNDARFIDDAFAMIADHPVAMRKLCFEITEGVALNDIAATRRFIDRIKMYGSKLALDDFGAGYTSFNYLKDIPADLIKIDGTFVKDINLNPANFAITRTIVDLTHELGMRSIAEWAETPETVSSLIELGVDFGQGFGLARPMDKRRVTEALSGGALVTDENVLRILSLSERGMPVTPGYSLHRGPNATSR